MINLKCSTVNDVWYQLLRKCLEIDEEGNFKNAYPTGIIQKGSFEFGQSRLQFPGIAIEIEFPDKDYCVIMPNGLENIAPTTMEKIENYFHNYIIGNVIPKETTYTYGSRLNEYDGIWDIIEMLKETPVTNQAVCEIGKPGDHKNCKGKDGKNDPPCLRVVDFKVVPAFKTCPNCNGHGWFTDSTEGGIPVVCGLCLYDENKGKGTGLILDKENSRLDMSVYWRSWDLFGGLPENLGGLSLLQQMVSGAIEIPIGKMYAYSSGLHLYGYQRELAEMRTHLNVKEF